MPSNRDLIERREADAYAAISELVERLEAMGDRCGVSETTWRKDVADRDALVHEANKAGINQELIGRLSGLGAQPSVSRAIARHKARVARGEREA